MNAKRQAFSQLPGTAARQTKWWCRQATSRSLPSLKTHHHHQHSHAAWTLIKTTAQIKSTHKRRHRLSVEATCFALVTFISSTVPSVKMSSWWKIYSNLLRFSLHKWHTQALVSPAKCPPKWCPSVEWVSACPQLSKYPSGSVPWLSANSKQCFQQNKVWIVKKSNLNA